MFSNGADNFDDANLQNISEPYFLAHLDYLGMEKEICGYALVLKVPAKNRCDFVNGTCCDHHMKEWFKIWFCDYQNFIQYIIPVHVVLILIYLQLLIINANTNIAPIFLVLNRKLKLGVHFTSITILAYIITGPPAASMIEQVQDVRN